MLPAALEFIEQHGKAAPSLPLGTVADEFLATKESGGLRPRYVKTLRASIKGSKDVATIREKIKAK